MGISHQPLFLFQKVQVTSCQISTPSHPTLGNLFSFLFIVSLLSDQHQGFFKLPIWCTNKWSPSFCISFIISEDEHFKNICLLVYWLSFVTWWFVFLGLEIIHLWLPCHWRKLKSVWMNEFLEFWAPPQSHRLRTTLSGECYLCTILIMQFPMLQKYKFSESLLSPAWCKWNSLQN